MERKHLIKLKGFVRGLSEKDARGQLFLAYRLMERCVKILNGHKKVRPVPMRDNGISSDLELFYKCKEVMKRKEKKDGENS